jgi:intracellular septation protein
LHQLGGHPVLFFGAFKYADGRKEWAANFASQHFGFLVAGGVVGQSEAPVLLATVVVVLATLAQVAFLLARGRKVDTMLWVSLVLVVVLGGLTVWFHSETFIKWKPTLLYWVMASAFLLAPLLFGKNLLRTLLGEQLQLPDPIWARLNWAWIGFFSAMGALNLWVAFNFATDTWVNFKLFGAMGLMFVFVIAQGLFISKYLPEEEKK